MSRPALKFTSPTWMNQVPESIKPFIQLARLHYFSGPNLLFWPCAWGLTLAAAITKISLASLCLQLAIYFIGSLLLHSIGATWNDICDKDLDGKVERTKNRPLVVGSVTVSAALWFLAPQVLILVGMLRLTNDLSFYLGIFGLFFWVALYPLMKRVTYWPQAWLGIAGNWGLLVAYASLTPGIPWSTAGTLFWGSWCWCMHYDTIYGMMDKRDDLIVGIKSTAILFGSYARIIISGFSIAFIISLFYVGKAIEAPGSYYIFTVGGAGTHLAWQTISVDFENQESCFRVFGSNATQLGYIVWLGLVAVYLHHV